MSERTRQVRKTLIIVLILNLTVAVLKFIFGMLSGAISMVADSFHSLFDSTSNIVGLIAVRLSRRPPDLDHPYGHRKYETIATLVISGLLLIVCFEIVEGSIQRFLNPATPEITLLVFGVMAGTTIVNYLVSRYEYRRGSELKSEILTADSHHTKSDVYASLSVLAGFIAIKLGYEIVDPVVALAIAFLIARTAYHIIRDASKTLCDVSMINPERIRERVESVNGVMDCHKIRTRGTQNQVYVDLHIRVMQNLSVEEAHEISTRVEEEIKDSMSEVEDVVVHIEPSGGVD